LEELEQRIAALELENNTNLEIREQLLHLNYTTYLHLNSLTKQLVEAGVVNKEKLALDMEELNKLNEKLHEFSDPQVAPTGEQEEVPAEV
jgi:hypothetical protein